MHSTQVLETPTHISELVTASHYVLPHHAVPKFMDLQMLFLICTWYIQISQTMYLYTRNTIYQLMHEACKLASQKKNAEQDLACYRVIKSRYSTLWLKKTEFWFCYPNMEGEKKGIICAESTVANLLCKHDLKKKKDTLKPKSQTI